MTHSGIFCFFDNFSRTSVKILVHFGVYNPDFVCQHARRGLFFSKKNHFWRKSDIYLLKKLKNIFFVWKIVIFFHLPGSLSITQYMGVSILLGTHNYPHLIRVGSAQNAILLYIVWPSRERSSRDLGGGKGGSGWILCDIPTGIQRVRCMAFCIGNGHTREKRPEIRARTT